MQPAPEPPPLPGGHQHRKVPGDDLPADADGFAARICEVVAVDRNSKFRRYKYGERESASDANKLRRVVERLTSSIRTYVQSFARIRFVRFSQPIGPEPDDSSGWYNRDGVVQAYSGLQNVFTDADDDVLTDSIFADDGRVIDEDERDFCVWLEQSGKWHPLNPARIRHAITCYDVDGTYPTPASGANKFPIKFVRIPYTEEAGYEAVDSQIIPPDNANDPHDYVLNLFEGNDTETPYIPHESVIWLYHVAGKDNKRGSWYTYICCEIPEHSSSSVSTSESSGSSSSSSSVSESSSSSGGSSESSSESSSQSVSTSSSESSSGGSSASSISLSTSSSLNDCITALDGITLSTLPTISTENAIGVLGIDADGCLGIIELGDTCDAEDTSSSSSGP